MTISLIINAATGKMGKELIRETVSDADVTVSAALARNNHPLVGTDLGYLIGANPQGSFISSNIEAALDDGQVLIDFSLPEHSINTLRVAVQKQLPLVIGTTGFNQDQLAEIKTASQQIPIMHSANYSLGVNVLIKLASQATQLLGKQSDIEIFEAHHKHKVDSPSGTALAIGDAIAEVKGKPLSDLVAYDRSGERKDGDIGFSVMRAGEIVGDHEVMFALNGELLSIKHHAQSRQCFAQGAIESAKWLFQQSVNGQNGLFSLQDMLTN